MNGVIVTLFAILAIGCADQYYKDLTSPIYKDHSYGKDYKYVYGTGDLGYGHHGSYYGYPASSYGGHALYGYSTYNPHSYYTYPTAAKYDQTYYNYQPYQHEKYYTQQPHYYKDLKDYKGHTYVQPLTHTYADVKTVHAVKPVIHKELHDVKTVHVKPVHIQKEIVGVKDYGQTHYQTPYHTPSFSYYFNKGGKDLAKVDLSHVSYKHVAQPHYTSYVTPHVTSFHGVKTEPHYKVSQYKTVEPLISSYGVEPVHYTSTYKEEHPINYDTYKTVEHKTYDHDSKVYTDDFN